MIKHLRAKEETVYRSAKVYEKSGLECVEKIAHKCNREQSVLGSLWKSDGDTFVQKVEEARHEVKTKSKKLEEKLAQLEGKHAKRGALYEHATASLRGLRDGLLEGEVGED